MEQVLLNTVSEEITNSMGEQKTAMREIMQSVADINDTTQQNAAGAEEMFRLNGESFFACSEALPGIRHFQGLSNNLSD